MKKILFLILFVTMLFSCGRLSERELEKEVKTALNEALVEDGLAGEISIVDLDLEHQGGDRYTGTVKMRGYGEVESYAIYVEYDGEYFTWEIPAFL